jgi:hypothetical protein
MNGAIFWDIAPCIPYVNRRLGGTSAHIQIHGVILQKITTFITTAVRTSSPIFRNYHLYWTLVHNCKKSPNALQMSWFIES